MWIEESTNVTMIVQIKLQKISTEHENVRAKYNHKHSPHAYLGDMSSIGTRHFDSGRGHNIGRMQFATHIALNERTLRVQSGVQADHIRAIEVVAPITDQAEVARC